MKGIIQHTHHDYLDTPGYPQLTTVFLLVINTHFPYVCVIVFTLRRVLGGI